MTENDRRSDLERRAASPETAERILAAWREGALVPRSGPGGDATVVVSGRGESYVAWRLTPEDGDPLAVRVPRLGPDDLAQPIGREMPVLAQLEPGIGPAPVALHAEAATSPVGLPCVVTTFVPGRVLDPEEWTREHLLAHARALAAMHRRAWPGRGPIASGTDPAADLARGSMSMLAECDGSFAWWRENVPAVCADSANAAIMDAARAVCEAAEPAFARLDAYALAHGDLVSTNIVWEDRTDGEASAPTCRYIDYEWAQADDRARDLAIIGGPVHAGPWYVPLGAEALEAFLQEYVRATRELDPGLELDADALRVRRDAWIAYERTAMLLHVARRAAAGDPLHRSVLAPLRELLTGWLAATAPA